MLPMLRSHTWPLNVNNTLQTKEENSHVEALTSNSYNDVTPFAERVFTLVVEVKKEQKQKQKNRVTEGK